MTIASRILVVCSLFYPLPAYGEMIFFVDPAAGDYRVASLSGLQVDGSIYTAHFYYDTNYRNLAKTLFPSDPAKPNPIDSENALIRFSDSATAEMVLQTIVDAINTTNVSVSPPSISATVFLVPIEVQPIGAGEEAVLATETFRSGTNPLKYSGVDSANTQFFNVFDDVGGSAWVTFDVGVAGVPEPATAVLLCSGLLAIAPWAMRRRWARLHSAGPR